ncbi:MAG TPA: rhodanese-like domain-containing protein [Symbiobacteriaceae bacterium]|nr:rhodanese-like domain-containing protein [Symbiobacteriaceae bacterium]
MNWLLWVLLALVIVYVGYQQWWLRRGVTHVSVHDIKALIDTRRRYFLVDIREPKAFEAGHILGAVNIPFGRLEQEAAQWERDREIMVICGRGQQSVLACRRLMAMGFTRVRNVDGGLRRWPWGTV